MSTTNALNNKSAPFGVTGDCTITSGNLNIPSYTDGTFTAGVINSGNVPTLYSSSAGSTFVGYNSGNTTYTSTGTTTLGTSTGSSLTNAVSNTLIGTNSGTALTSGGTNTFVGHSIATVMTSGVSNTIVGCNMASAATFNGSRNLMINAGNSLGSGSYTGTEGSNVLIQNTGVAAESNTIHIGTNGTGNGQQNQTFLHGGNVNMPNSAGAGVRNGTLSNVTGDGTAYTVIYGTQEFNQASFFTGSGVFTAPVTGNYLICLTVTINGILAAHTQGKLILHATARDYQIANINPFATFNATAAQLSMSGSIVIAMTAADTVSSILTITGGTKVIGSTSIFSNFSGVLVS